jgi:hypothetical protein
MKGIGGEAMTIALSRLRERELKGQEVEAVTIALSAFRKREGKSRYIKKDGKIKSVLSLPAQCVMDIKYENFPGATKEPGTKEHLITTDLEYSIDPARQGTLL